jgi:hypothetical protein
MQDMAKHQLLQRDRLKPKRAIQPIKISLLQTIYHLTNGVNIRSNELLTNKIAIATIL